jgi:1-acyl-sn-glycerol-3-phosphate acyltransferase
VLLDEFKEGAFKMAIAHGIEIIPITFFDNKRRLPFSLFRGGPGKLRVRVHPFIATTGQVEKTKLKEQVRQIILADLKKGAPGCIGGAKGVTAKQ